MSQNSTPVLALGMHRSGTSFLASLLAGLGVHMGESLLAPDAGNPRGYFEELSILAFHKKLLSTRMGNAQTRADFLPRAGFSPAWSDEERAEAKALIAKLARPGFWGWKEPRSCLFLPQWLELLPDARCVAVFRHPLEIYYSFLKRGDWSALFAPESIFEACAMYNESIMAAREAAPERFMVLDAAIAFRDISALSQKLASFLGMEAPDLSSLPKFATEEFSSLGIVPEQHELMSHVYPGAGWTYERMQAIAEQAAPFASDCDAASLPPALMDPINAAAAADRENHPSGKGRIQLGQAIIDAFCLNLPQERISNLRSNIAAKVEAEHAKLAAERDEYIGLFEKYKTMYENYFEAWKGSDRTLAETRLWIDSDLKPKIDRWRKQLQDAGIAYEE